MSDRAERSWKRALQYLQSGQESAARAVLETLVAGQPEHAEAWLLLGGIAWRQDHIRDSISHALKAYGSNLWTADLVCDVIAALIQVGESRAAHELFGYPLLQETGDGNLLLRLSGQAQKLGEHALALSLLERAGGAGVSGADYQVHLGVQQAVNGQLHEAEMTLESSARANPAFGRGVLMLSRMKKQTAERNHLEQIRQGLNLVEKGGEEHAALEFASYKELEDLGRFDEAWQALTAGNAIMHARLKHDPVREARLFERLMSETSRWGPDDGGNLAKNGDEPQPIFILGMPRSGTTVLDRILDNHSQVHSVGELPDFEYQLRWAVDHCTPSIPDDVALDRLNAVDFHELGKRYLARTRWRTSGKRFYVDKLPANWAVAGLILRALPQARVLHLVRDPMDVCFSNYRALFGDSYPYSYDLAALASHHQTYRRVMQHWHTCFPGCILDVMYRGLVDDTSAVAQQVFDFCGLEFEPGCVDVTRNRGAVATLSMVQARQPIHARAFREWEPYARQLEPLRALLETQLATDGATAAGR